MAGWTCPECHRQFGRRNQSHECAPSGSVDAYFATRPPVQRKIFDRILAHLKRVGPVVVDPVSVCVMFKRTRTFAEVRSKKNALALYFLLSPGLDHPRIARRMKLSAHRTAYVVDLDKVGDVDADVRGWLRDAYLSSPP